ncbi:hypothetical protein LMG33818_001109 [Halomonadaceae bacterium LMG 33818]|uniref:O-antigen ligase family protein n=1 Tax=Cernens ardua TaxID=3402176 RepID=UPI003EDBBC5C
MQASPHTKKTISSPNDLKLHWSVRLLDSLIILSLVIGYFMMSFDRNSAQHLLYGATFAGLLAAVLRICLVTWTKFTYGNTNNELSTPGGYKAPLQSGVLFGLSTLLLVVAGVWWEVEYGASGQLAWMNEMAWKVSGFWLCATVLIFYFSAFNVEIFRYVKALLPILCLIGAMALLVSGGKQYLHGIHRIELKLGYPVPAGFILACLLLVAQVVSASIVCRWQRMAYLVVIALMTAVLVTLTGTRDALLVLLLIVIGLLWEYRHGLPQRFRQPWVYSLVVLLVAIALGAAFVARFDQLWGDLDSFFHGVPSGSMGGRFVIWEAGLHSFLENPWGYTGNARFMVVQGFLQHILVGHEFLVPHIMWAAQHHMHSELIEAMSLMGVVGLLAVVLFYITFFMASRRTLMHPMGRWLWGGVIVFGLAEPILNSDKTGLCLAFIIPLCLACSHDTSSR